MKTNVRTPLQRVLSMLLCVAMLLSVPVVPVGATGTEPADDVIPETTAPAETEAETTAPEDGTIEIVGEAPILLGAEAPVYNAGVQDDDIETFSSDAIKINLFNYSDHINKVIVGTNENGTTKYAWDAITQYFSFRGGTQHYNIDPNAGENDNGIIANAPAIKTEKDANGNTVTYYPKTADDQDIMGITASGYNTASDTDGFTATHATLKNSLDNGNPSLDLHYDALGHPRTWTKNAAGEVVYKDLFEGVDYYSLDYLFDPDVKHHAVTAYEAKNLPLIEVPGDYFHYYYNSKDNAVDFDTETQMFRLRNYVERTSSTAGYDGFFDFLPFNYTGGIAVDSTGEPVVDADGNAVKLSDDLTVADAQNYYSIHSYKTDYWFGMTMEIEFYMTKDGMLTEDGRQIPMEFFFSGDDDVWVFVDNALVLDLGGTHGTVDGSINFATGEVKQYLSWNKNQSDANWNNYVNNGGSLTAPTAEGVTAWTYKPLWDTNSKLNESATSFPTDLKTRFTEAGLEPNGGWNEDGTTFADYTRHTLKFFYLERGSAVANCKLDFRLPVLPNNSLTVGKKLTVEGTGAGTEDAEFVQNSLSYQFRVWKAPEEGSNVLNEYFITPGTTYAILEGGNPTGRTGIVDQNGLFTLRAGEQAQFTDMLVKGEGDIYYVVEEILPKELTGQYGDVEYVVDNNVAGTTKPEGGAETTFSAFQTGKLSAEATQFVTFNNPVIIDNLGTLKITKTAEDNVNADKQFRIQVKLGGALLPVGTEYTIGDVVYTVDTPGIILLKKGQTAVLENKILSGTAFEVVELLSNDEKFEATYTGTIKDKDGNELGGVTIGDGVSGTFGLNNTVEITVHNKSVALVVEVPLLKTAPGNTETETFAFVADQITSKDDRTVKKANAGVANITVNDAALTSGVLKLNYEGSTTPGVYYYEIREVAGTNDFIYDNSRYVVEVTIASTVDGLSGTVTGIWKNGEGDNLSNAAFTNQKLTEIVVTKTVKGYSSDEEFAFTVSYEGFSETFTLKDKGSKTIANIPVGAVVTVQETSADGYVTYHRINTDAYEVGNTATVTAVDNTALVNFTNAKYTADDMVVIDYGLPVEVNVLSNDAFPDGVKVTLVSGKGTYGEAVVTNDNKIRYVLNGLTMDGTDVFTYQVTYAPVTGCETTFEAKLTIIPATTIYYEDSFVALKTYNVKDEPIESNWVTEGTPNGATQDEDRPGQSLGGLDADNLYGYDDAYEECATWSGGSARMTHVWNTVGKDGTVTDGVYSTAEFTFKGTGFDVISMTGGNTGTIFITVTSTDPDNKFSKNYMVDTYYGYTYENGEWTVKENATDCLYQIPVMKISGLAYGEYKVTILATYNAFFDHGQYNGTGETDGYDFYLDAIRIYDPANDGTGNKPIEDAYKADGEGWPEYYELRNLIIAADTFNALTDNSAAVGGIVFIDGNGENSSIEDYTNFGPNNEVYLAAGQSIAFDLNAGAEFTGEIAKVQIGVKLAQGAPVASIYDAADAANAESKKTIDVNTATDLYYEITNLNGKTVVITNTGEGILSITNIKVTFKAAPTQAENPASVFSVSRETAELALASLKLAPEIFVPNNLNAKLNKNEIKVGQKVNVTVTTSRDVAYITVNGQKITTAQLNTKNGSLTWKTTVTGEEVGEMEIEIIVYSKDGVAGEPVIKVVKVQAKSNGGNTGKWPGLIKKPYDLPIGDWFN